MKKPLLSGKWTPLWIRLFSLFLFFVVILILGFGTFKFFSIKLESKLAMILLWTLWWPLLYITLLFVGRLWCGFVCPLSLANEFGNLFKRKKLRVIRWGFFPFLVFVLVVYFEQISGLFLSVNLTLWLLVAAFVLAFIFGVLFPGFSFCLFVCPVGTLLRVFGRLSILGLRVNKKICEKCKTFDCLKGNKNGRCPAFLNIPKNASSSKCLLCTRCIKNCPYGSPKLRFVKPGVEIRNKIGFSKSESIFIIILLAIETILTTNGNLLYRRIFPTEFVGYVLRLSDFIIAIGVFLGLYFFITYFTTLISKQEFKAAVREYGYVYLPISFFIMFFTIIFGFLGPLFSISEYSAALMKYISLAIGIVWSFIILLKFTKRYYFHAMLILGIAILWVFYLIPGPLNLFEEDGRIVTVGNGELIEIESFSMGYDPSVIIVKKDSLVKMRIDNIDIIHSIDIDEFDVHEVIEGGDVSYIEFIPDKPGEFKIYCAIPGHEEAGMVAKLIVR